jgi:acetyl-CoA synthetase
VPVDLATVGFWHEGQWLWQRGVPAVLFLLGAAIVVRLIRWASTRYQATLAAEAMTVIEAGGTVDDTTGQAIVAFVTVKASTAQDPASGQALIKELREHVAREIGPIAKPRQILLVPELPKTRSGKIMRRLLRDVTDHRELGDVTTLLDPTVVNAIKDEMASQTE